MKYYLTTNPFTLTNIETHKTEYYENLDSLINRIINEKSLEAYVHELDKLAHAIIIKLFDRSFEEISTGDVERLDQELPSKKFIVVGTIEERSIINIRIKKTQKKQATLYNTMRIFGGASITDIIGSVGTDDEIEGMCLALNHLAQQGHKGWTISSIAMTDLKNESFGRMVDGKLKYGYINFKEWFPILDTEVHDFVMESYQGGLCYFNPKYRGINEDLCGVEYDVNSMYPSIMAEEFLPYGEPKRFEGKFNIKENRRTPLYFQKVRIEKLSIKKDCVPTIRDSKNQCYYTEAENIEIVLNEIDLELMNRNYDVIGIEYLGGYAFHGRKCMFNKFIGKWVDRKIKATEQGDKFNRMIAKLMLNSAYGKFASRTDRKPAKYYKLPNGNIVRRPYMGGKRTKEGNMIYCPVGAYITSYARKRLLNAIDNNKDNFIYSDTDSIYIKGDKAIGMEIDPNKLGAWKEEFKFTKMTIINKKQYIVQKEDGSIKVACAGMPTHVMNKIKSFDEFYVGAIFDFEITQFDKEGFPYQQKMPTYKLKDENIL